MKFIDNESFEKGRKARAHHDWSSIARELKGQAMMWGEVMVGQKSAGARMNAAVSLSRYGVFGIAVRKQEDGTYKIYARFIREHGA